MRCAGTILILAIFYVNSFIQDARACSCVPLQKRLFYCNAEFAVKAKVVNEQRWPFPRDIRVYMIKTGGGKLLRTLKGNFTNVDLTKVYTQSKSSTCGITLEQDKVYLLTGHIDASKCPHRLSIVLCDWIQTWRTLSRTEKTFVTKGYLNGCP
ncbi:hypothetical protein ACJMK2_019503 [Sinanodonta woodiana]|uniref:NTR domain-containing protein n=1 Tax=Sinanodonta woodiana TaxID=1069815 RepID=A0ABD3TVX8_SINWO